MAFSAITGTPLIPVGAANRQSVPNIIAITSSTLNATGAATEMIGQMFWEDGGTHTVDTTGSSSLGWRTAGVTFASGTTSVKVGLAPIDAANGPAPRAVNAANLVTFDVSKTMAGGGGGITNQAWQEHVPDTGTKTIAHGDLVVFAIQMVVRGGADIVPVVYEALAVNNQLWPAVTNVSGSTYTNGNLLPNVVVTAHDGTRGYIYGGFVVTSITTQTWNNTSGTKEYGNLFTLPMPVRIYGIYAGVTLAGDTDFVLYTDPLGTPVAQKTVSVDLNTIATASSGTIDLLFPAPYDLPANTPVAAIIKPTSATNISALYKSFNIAGHQNSETIGSAGYAVNRNTGAFAAQNSSKDRFPIGLLIGAIQDGVGTFPTSFGYS